MDLEEHFITQMLLFYSLGELIDFSVIMYESTFLDISSKKTSNYLDLMRKGMSIVWVIVELSSETPCE